MITADYALFCGLADIWTFNCGRRPHVKDESVIYAMILKRFELVA